MNETALQGGEPRFDASAPVSTVDAAVSCGDPDAGPEAGHTYAELYRDFFGPTGKASCAGTGVCHGDATQPGATGTDPPYICGATADACYKGMQAGLLITPTAAGADAGPADDSYLYEILRKCSGGGSMPKQPATVVFVGSDLTRIRAWLSEGAPND